MQRWISQGTHNSAFPTIHLVSDALGQTAQAVSRAAAATFGEHDAAMEIWSEVPNAEVLEEELNNHLALHRRTTTKENSFVLFYTLVDTSMRKVMKTFVEDNPEVVAVDILDPVIEALTLASGLKPSGRVGARWAINDKYFKRIEAIEFTIAHDDGRNPQDLTDADIVLIGVSRSSKTPLSIYLSQSGYKVANIPLDPLTQPPAQLFDVDPTRLFGLMTSPEVLVDIRRRRLGNASHIASSYADLENVYQDLEKSRALMRKLGCIVVRTDNRAIEETAQEILRYYTAAHPMAGNVQIDPNA